MWKGSSAVADLKLFGSTIPSCHTHPCRSSKKDVMLEAASMEGIFSEPICVSDDGDKVVKEGAFAVATTADTMQFHMLVGNKESPTSANIGNQEALPPLNQGGEETDEKIRKKPKKLLPCPRCQSLNTKFCYFNNCNVKQPRHFCKKCQRYWTAGGTLRNVPVGSGRRKSKHHSSSASYSHSQPHPHHPCPFLNPSDNLSERYDVVDSDQQSPQAHSITVMKMGCSAQVRPQDFSSLSVSDSPKSSFVRSYGKETPPSPLCQSLGAGSIREQSVVGQEYSSGSQETFASNTANQGQPHLLSPPMDELARSSVVAQSLAQACETTESSKQPTRGGGLMGNSPFSFPVGPSPSPSPLPWPYGYGHFGWNNDTLPLMPTLSDLSLAAWYGHPWMGGGLPWPLWSMPWNPSTVAMAAAMASAYNPILGKHPQDRSHTDSGEDGCLLTPKTLRMQDPKEAAQSSIWSALGLDNSHNSGGIFKGFPPKADGLAVHETEEVAAQSLLANPAAKNRSMSFHENG